MKFCEECGNKLDPGAKFCERCGASLAPAAVPTAAPVQPAQPATPGRPADTSTGKETGPAGASKETFANFLDPKYIRPAILGTVVVFVGTFAVLAFLSVIASNGTSSSLSMFEDLGLWVPSTLFGAAFFGIVQGGGAGSVSVASVEGQAYLQLAPLGIAFAFLFLMALIHRPFVRKLTDQAQIRYALVTALVSGALMAAQLLIFGKAELASQQSIAVATSALIPTLAIIALTFVVISWPVWLKKLSVANDLAVSDLRGFVSIATVIAVIVAFLGAVGLLVFGGESWKPGEILALLIAALFWLPTLVFGLIVTSVFGSFGLEAKHPGLSSLITGETPVPAWLRILVIVIVLLTILAAIGSKRMRQSTSTYWRSALLFGGIGILYSLVAMPNGKMSGQANIWVISFSTEMQGEVSLEALEAGIAFATLGALIGGARHPAVIHQVQMFADPVWNIVSPLVAWCEKTWQKVLTKVDSPGSKSVASQTPAS